MIKNEKEEHFKDLKSQIFDKNRWDAKRFNVYSYEAGSGKSRTAQEILAQTDERALYVQKFSKDGLLNETAERINLLAGKEVAISFSGDDTKVNKKRRKAVEAQILCITHKMYLNICKGYHSDLLADRKILVIDEYPDLLEPISVSRSDIGMLFTDMFQYSRIETDEIAVELRRLAYDLQAETERESRQKMLYIQFTDTKYDKYRAVTNELLKEAKARGKKVHVELLFRIQQILKNGCYYYEQGFHTINSDFFFVLLDCNIVLDANKNDYRYIFSNIFNKMDTPQQFSFVKAKFCHYEVNTSKKSLKSYLNLTEKALECIGLEKCKGVLFVTDKDNENAVKEGIESFYNDSFDSIQLNMGFPIEIDHFGNLIGRNNFRNFDTVIVLKTPNFDFRTYALTSFFYKYHGRLPINDVSVFQDETVEKIRLSSVAGEIYQAVRRVARDNPGEANIHVFNSNQEVMDLVIQQLVDIQYEKRHIDVNKTTEKGSKVEGRTKQTYLEEKAEEVKKILLDLQGTGVEEVKKKDIRMQVGVNDSSNFTRVLNELQSFMQLSNIENRGRQKLRFKQAGDVL